MGAPLGYFSDDNPNDYPELNKCPDCETYFEGLYCPICGKECPVEMRAGNRKPMKKKKVKKGRRNNGRVEFIPWYQSGWFILLMFYMFPIVGIVLLCISKISWKQKVAVVAVALILWMLSAGLGAYLLSKVFPVSYPDVPKEEYLASCNEVNPEDLYRKVGKYRRQDVKLTLRCLDKYTNQNEAGQGISVTYYECVANVNGRGIPFLLQDCQTEDDFINILPGDQITVWGRVLGNRTVYLDNGTAEEVPCIASYYLEVIPERTTVRNIAADLRKKAVLC